MASIDRELEGILSGRYGKDVRIYIHDACYKLNQEGTNYGKANPNAYGVDKDLFGDEVSQFGSMDTIASENQLAEFKSKINNLTSRVQNLEKTINDQKNKLEDHETRIRTLEQRVREMESHISALQNQIASMKTTTYDTSGSIGGSSSSAADEGLSG